MSSWFYSRQNLKQNDTDRNTKYQANLSNWLLFAAELAGWLPEISARCQDTDKIPWINFSRGLPNCLQARTGTGNIQYMLNHTPAIISVRLLLKYAGNILEIYRGETKTQLSSALNWSTNNITNQCNDQPTNKPRLKVLSMKISFFNCSLPTKHNLVVKWSN